MNAEEFSKNILNLDPSIRFSGLVEKSGHLYAGIMREGLDEHLKGRNPEIQLFPVSIYCGSKKNVYTRVRKPGFCNISIR